MPKLGEKHHNVKLSDVDVRKMRVMWLRWGKEGMRGRGYGSLANVFGCSKWTARDIVTYRTRIGA
jgi:hypothetical protein